MKEKRNKETVIWRKKQSIRELNNLIESYLADGSDKMLKKADLLSYWINKYAKYIKMESTFDPKKQISYKRGDIIKLDFGFKIGAEYGGLHYAIVLDNQNDHSSPLVTVIPLTSGSENETFRTDVFLGNELYSKLNSKHTKLLNEIMVSIKETEEMRQSISSSISSTRNLLSHYKETDNNDEKINMEQIHSDMDRLQQQLDYAEEREKLYKKEIIKLDTLSNEILKMKSGSIALIKQITTVSKQRIYEPRKSSDPLYKISLSPSQMNKINDAVKKCYFFE